MLREVNELLWTILADNVSSYIYIEVLAFVRDCLVHEGIRSPISQGYSIFANIARSSFLGSRVGSI